MNRRTSFSGFLAAVSLVLLAATTSPALERGDVDADGVVRVADALLVLRHAAGTQSLTLSQRTACDVGGGSSTFTLDFVCDITDAVLILNKAYGLLSF